MLKLLPIQPPEAPASEAAQARVTEYKTRLEDAPDTKRGDWHPAAEIAFKAALATEGYISRLIELRDEAKATIGGKASDDYQTLIDVTLDYLADIVGEAEHRAEEDAPPYNHEDCWPRLVVTL